MIKREKSTREQACDFIIDELETKYLGTNFKKVANDKYFRMLLQGMTVEEATSYTKAKLTLIRDYHRD
jgi:hypothetical protein